jgi:chitosanase
MRATQDLFFDDAYWRPAQRAAEIAKIACALGVALVYDSCVHGAWKMLRDRTNARATIDQCGEQAWLQTYVSERRNWLAQHSRKDLRGTVYRMEAFQRLIDQGYWELELPLVVRGAEISLITLAATPPHCYEGPPPGARILSLQSPLQCGLDVRLLQLELSDRDIDIVADGVFGPTCMNCIKHYQAHNGLPVTGAVDAALIEHLGMRKIIAPLAAAPSTPESISMHYQFNRLEQPVRG